MHVEIVLTVLEMDEQLLEKKTAVIIDTLRATSTIVTALANGASRVEPLARIEEAKQRGSELVKTRYLLCGEREGVKITGFDLGNSPLEFTQEIVTGKQILLTTTNGTLAIKKAHRAEQILIGSLLNKTATMIESMKLGLDLVLCCSGTKGHFSLEDFVTAGAMISFLQAQDVEIIGDDRVCTAQLLYERYVDDLVELMSCSQNGIRLIAIDHFEDIQFCAQEDLYPYVCRFDGRYICR